MKYTLTANFLLTAEAENKEDNDILYGLMSSVTKGKLVTPAKKTAAAKEYMSIKPGYTWIDEVVFKNGSVRKGYYRKNRVKKEVRGPLNLTQDVG